MGVAQAQNQTIEFGIYYLDYVASIFIYSDLRFIVFIFGLICTCLKIRVYLEYIRFKENKKLYFLEKLLVLIHIKFIVFIDLSLLASLCHYFPNIWLLAFCSQVLSSNLLTVLRFFGEGSTMFRYLGLFMDKLLAIKIPLVIGRGSNSIFIKVVLLILGNWGVDKNENFIGLMQNPTFDDFVGIIHNKLSHVESLTVDYLKSNIDWTQGNIVALSDILDLPYPNKRYAFTVANRVIAVPQRNIKYTLPGRPGQTHAHL